MNNIILQNLEEVLTAINNFIDKGISFINTKKIRKFFDIDYSNKSKTYFIWHSLKLLKMYGILEEIEGGRIINYKIVKKEKINIQEFLEQLQVL